MTERELRREAVEIGIGILGTPGVWGGDFGRTVPGADCSGWIVHGIWQPMGLAPAHPWDAGSRWLWGQLERLPAGELPKRGDLAFYGRLWVSHVMMVAGEAEHLPVPVMGVSGAKKSIRTVEAAVAADARARTFATHLYRRDFRGFARMPLDGRLLRSVV